MAIKINIPPHEHRKYKQGSFYILKRRTLRGCQLCGLTMSKGQKVWRFEYGVFDSTGKSYQKKMVYIHAKHLKFHDKNKCPDRYKTMTGATSKCILCK